MAKLKVISNEDLKDWAKEIFKENSFNMVNVSSKKETFRRALASGKIFSMSPLIRALTNNSNLLSLFSTIDKKALLNWIHISNFIHLLIRREGEISLP